MSSFLLIDATDYLLIQSTDRLLIESDINPGGSAAGGASKLRKRIKQDDEEVMRIVEAIFNTL